MAAAGRVQKFLFGTAMVAAALVCVRLGVWQLDRLDQRRSFNEVVKSRSEMSPIQLRGSALEAGFEYRSVQATGTLDPAHPTVLVGKVLGGRLGAHVLVPLLFPNGNGILVNLGWVEVAEETGEAMIPELPTDTLEIEGYLTRSADEPTNMTAEGWPIRARAANVRELSQLYEAPLAPAILVATTAVSGFETVPRPALGEGPHFAYALQWFGFALVALVGTYFLLRKQRV